LVQYLLVCLYVCIVRAGVQPTVDPYVTICAYVTLKYNNHWLCKHGLVGFVEKPVTAYILKMNV